MENTLKENAGDYQKDLVTDEQYKAENPDYVDTDGNEKLHLSEDLKAAVKAIIKSEIGDKTFCLIIIFTISWTNWNSPSPSDTLNVKGKEIDTKVKNSVNPLRIWFASTFATSFVTVMTCLY